MSVDFDLSAGAMGGFGSGRPATHITCEASLKLDLAEPAIRGALPLHRNRAGTWQWSSNRTPAASIGYRWRGGAAQLDLRYTCNGEAVFQSIRVVTSQPRFGGARLWFVCPFTGRRVRALYLPPGAKLWASRHAYELRYQSQREAHFGRTILRLFLMCGGAGKDGRLAAALAHERDPLGILAEHRDDRRETARSRRLGVRRITRQQRRNTS